MRLVAPAAQTRRKTSVPLVPPNPKLFFTATSMRISRAVFYDLVQRAVPGTGADENTLGVWSGGVFFRLGPLP